jgi:1-acyl-sn-glycerol-3-phosphate acyltransferase
MAKIQDISRSYFAVKFYVDIMFKWAYRRIVFHGKEKLPQDGAIIYAPNHTNTLMDALAVLAMDKTHKVFATRADIFKHPTVLKALTFLKMLPINRKRDGMSNLAKNEEINNIAVDVLHDKVPFCILPEGMHRAKHSLMILQKGIFRIALQANDTFGNEMPVYIVPVGIEFGHFFRYRSALLLQIGEPINVTQFVKDHPELALPQQQIKVLREELSDRIKKIILHTPDDANYNATFELAQIYGNEQQQRLKLKGNSLINRFTAAKETIENIGELLNSNPQETQELLDMADAFSKQRQVSGISMKSVLKSHILLSSIGEKMLLLLGLPYFIFSAVVTSPVTILFKWISSKFEDPAFYNSLRFLISLALLPVLWLLMGTIVAIFLPWVWTLVFTLLYIPAFIYFYDYIHLVQNFISDIKWITHKGLRKKFEEIKHKLNILIQ